MEMIDQLLLNFLSEDNLSIGRWVLLLIVLVLVFMALVWLFKRLTGPRSASGVRSKKARLALTDAARVDDGRSVILLRRDDVEHLLLIGGPNDLVIESNIHRLSETTQKTPTAAASAAAPLASVPAPSIAAQPSSPAPAPAVAQPSPSPVSSEPSKPSRSDISDGLKDMWDTARSAQAPPPPASQPRTAAVSPAPPPKVTPSAKPPAAPPPAPAPSVASQSAPSQATAPVAPPLAKPGVQQPALEPSSPATAAAGGVTRQPPPLATPAPTPAASPAPASAPAPEVSAVSPSQPKNAVEEIDEMLKSIQVPPKPN